jgi:hypothetical protein
LTEPEVEKLIKADTAVAIAACEDLDFHSLSNPSSQYLARLAAEAITVINAPITLEVGDLAILRNLIAAAENCVVDAKTAVASQANSGSYRQTRGSIGR